MEEITKSIRQLKSRADQAKIATTPKNFFPALHIFAASLFSNPHFAPALKEIEERYSALQRVLKAFEDAAREELQMKYTQVKHYVADHNVNNPSVAQALDQFGEQSWKNSKGNLLYPLDLAIWLLLNGESADHSEFIVQICGKITIIGYDKSINIEEAFPAYCKWTKEAAYFTQDYYPRVGYALNQIKAFAERYDLRYHDYLVDRLTKEGVNISKLQEERIELINYACLGREKGPWIPSIEEYKQYMLRIIDGVDDFFARNPRQVNYAYNFDPKTNDLVIEGYKPIKFKRDTNASSLLNFLVERKWKETTWTQVHESTSLEPEMIKRTIRQINDRVRKEGALPPFLITLDHRSRLNEKTVSVDRLYKKSTS